MTNAGGIYGTAVYSAAIVVEGGGTVTNSGKLIAGNLGVYIGGGANPATNMVTNTGTISGTETNSSGVVLHSGGTVNNNTGGMISGATGLGAYIGGVGGTVNNQSGGDDQRRRCRRRNQRRGGYGEQLWRHLSNGNIRQWGFAWSPGGIVNNHLGAKIGAQYIGVQITGGLGTVTNGGSIQSYGTHSAIHLALAEASATPEQLSAATSASTCPAAPAR